MRRVRKREKDRGVERVLCPGCGGVVVLRGSEGYDPYRCSEMADRLLRALNKSHYTAEDRERDRVIRAALDGAGTGTTRKVA